jgi:hypothetical protein
MVNVKGLFVIDAGGTSPDHNEKWYPFDGVAVRVTIAPFVYHPSPTSTLPLASAAVSR